MSEMNEMNGPNFDGDIRHGSIWGGGRWHRIKPREMVGGDIWPNSGSPVAPPSDLGLWSKNIRTVRLVALNTRLSERVREAESVVCAKQDTINVRDDQLVVLRQQLDALSSTVKVNNDFIAMLSKRLINARNHITRVRQACDTFEPNDGGPRLDP